MMFKDADPESDFFFQVVGFSSPHGTLQMQLRYAPSSQSSVRIHDASFPLPQIQAHFDKWLGLLQAYENVVTPFDDPLLKQYEDEFTQFFEVTDEDADVRSFDWEKQQRIDKLLGEFVDAASDSALSGDMDSQAAEVLIAEATQLRQTQATLTKSQLGRRIRVLIVKARKASIKFTIEVLKGALAKALADALNGRLPTLLN